MLKPFGLPTVLFVLTWAAFLGLPILLAWVFLSGHIGSEALAVAFPNAALPETVSDAQRYGAAVIGLLPWVCLMAVLWRTQALMALYRRGLALTSDAAGHIRAIGVGVFALGLAKAVAHTLQLLVLTASNPAGERVLAISLGSSEIGFMLAGGLLITIGQSMGEAARQAEELRGFV